MIPPSTKLMLRSADNVKHMGILKGKPLVEAVSVQNILCGTLRKAGGRDIGGVIQFFHNTQNLFPGGRGNIHFVIQYFADGCNRNTGSVCDVLNSVCHKILSFFGKRFLNLAETPTEIPLTIEKHHATIQLDSTAYQRILQYLLYNFLLQFVKRFPNAKLKGDF